MKPLIDPINTDDGQFHGRDNQTGQLATIVTPVYMNDTQDATRSMQREVISILTAAGIKPADATNDQLLSALKGLFLAEDDSRVSGALQKDKNLSDLTDAGKAKVTLGLDKVGNFIAVQQGGGIGQNANKVYVGWKSNGKLGVTVDETDEGEFFTTKNPPTASDANAYPISGGTLNGGVVANTGNAGLTKPASAWNEASTSNIIFQALHQNGVDNVVSDFYLNSNQYWAWRIYISNNDGSLHVLEFRNDGSLRVPGGLYDGSGRAYSPGNCPFPVGYVMLMGNGTDPNGVYPGTTWQCLNTTGYDGRAIVLGTDVLQTGGSNTVTLAEAHMPPHRHNGGATGDASTKPDADSAAWGTGRFGTDAKGGYALMQTSAAGSGQAFSVQNEYVHLLGWMRTS